MLMAISLSQLCENAERSYSMRLIAGSGGVENTVRWVHIVEDSEVPDFLHGNELIFTTGIAHSGNEWLKDFVISLKAKGAVGLVVNIGPYITAVPSPVIVFCEQNDFPLFTIPWATRIVDISYEFCRRIIGNEKRESTIGEAFRAIIKDPAALKNYGELFSRAEFGEKSRYTVISLTVLSNGTNVTKSAVQSMDMSIWRTIKHSNFHSSLFMHNGSFIAVRQNCSSEEIDRFCGELERVTGGTGRSVYMGISHTVNGLAETGEAYEQADAAMLMSMLHGQPRTHYRELGIMKLVFAVKNQNVLREFVRENLGTLRRFDVERNADYCETLRLYLTHSGSVNEVAESTGVHRNTINIKMRAIREIVGKELDDNDKSSLILAFLIEEVLDMYDKRSDIQ